MSVEFLLTAAITEDGCAVSQEVIDAICDDLNTYLANYDPPGPTTTGVLKGRVIQVENLQLS